MLSCFFWSIDKSFLRTTNLGQSSSNEEVLSISKHSSNTEASPSDM